LSGRQYRMAVVEVDGTMCDPAGSDPSDRPGHPVLLPPEAERARRSGLSLDRRSVGHSERWYSE